MIYKAQDLRVTPWLTTTVIWTTLVFFGMTASHIDRFDKLNHLDDSGLNLEVDKKNKIPRLAAEY